MAARRALKSPEYNRILLTIGTSLLAVAAVGFFLEKSDSLVGAFLAVGATMSIISVLAPRLEGRQEFGLAGAKLNIALAVKQAERELETKILPTLEELK